MCVEHRIFFFVVVIKIDIKYAFVDCVIKFDCCVSFGKHSFFKRKMLFVCVALWILVFCWERLLNIRIAVSKRKAHFKSSIFSLTNYSFELQSGRIPFEVFSIIPWRKVPFLMRTIIKSICKKEFFWPPLLLNYFNLMILYNNTWV